MVFKKKIPLEQEKITEELVEKPVKDRAYLQSMIESKRQTIQSDNPHVEIAKMNLDALKVLSDENNLIFSELTKNSMIDEPLLYALAYTFATNPLKGLEARCRSKGIDLRIEDDIGKNMTIEYKKQRQCTDRKRTDEYLRGIDFANRKDALVQSQEPRRGIFSRLG